ncbi:MAG TPA: adenylate/guanylate cyclase domain-containing protein [Thermoleophilaceae bacterium]|nr:adenylate/guanylate cyclase domain-containing protein [Thermoleophilaceae bacterium]
MTGKPRTRYAQAGDVSIAYQVVGDGPVDLVFFPGWFSHMDLQWEDPVISRWLDRLASFSRLILFDKRGVGLSDPVASAPTLDERMDDIRAVMDVAGSERAAIFGLSEGGTMSALFAAAHPERVTSLILFGSWAMGPELVREERFPGWERIAGMTAAVDAALDDWGQGGMVRHLAPSVADNPAALEHMGRFERAALSRAMARDLWAALSRADARPALPLISAPTLVIHRRDEIIPVEQAHYVAEHIAGARMLELPGADHLPWIGDSETVAAEVEEFVTGARRAPDPDRVLATVLFTDIVDSTARATSVGDREWRRLLDAHDELVRRELARHEGREAKHTGDGFLATFPGPARAVQCACRIRDEAPAIGLEVRAGLHSGECEFLGSDVRGVAIHIGARVVGRAGPGEVLVSRTVRDLLFGSSVEFAPRGRHALKGLPDEWELFAIAGN